MDDSDSSSDDNDHTPKRKGSRKKSGFDDSPISNVSFGSESPVVPWDFPRPKVSKKVKEAAKELGQMMNQVCRSKRKRQKFIERPEIPIDPLSSPVSRYQNSYSRTSFIDNDESSIDYEALEKIDLGRLDSSHCLNSSLSSDRPVRNPRTSINLPTLNLHKKFRFNDDKSPKTKLLSEILFKEKPKDENIKEKTIESDPKGNLNSKKGKPSEQWVSKTGINKSTKSKFGVSTKQMDSEKSNAQTSAQNINKSGHSDNSQVHLKEDLQIPTQPSVSSVQELLEEDMCFFLTPELASL